MATQLLAEGCHVISDATNMRRRERATSLAVPGAARRLLIWCEADEATAAARFALRADRQDPHDSSEATPMIRERMAANAEPPVAGEADVLFYVTPDTYEAALEALVTTMADLQ